MAVYAKIMEFDYMLTFRIDFFQIKQKNKINVFHAIEVLVTIKYPYDTKKTSDNIH